MYKGTKSWRQGLVDAKYKSTHKSSCTGHRDIYIYHWLRFISRYFDFLGEIRNSSKTTFKVKTTRIKPLALANGHGRYNITVIPERALLSVGRWPLHITVTVTVT